MNDNAVGVGGSEKITSLQMNFKGLRRRRFFLLGWMGEGGVGVVLTQGVGCWYGLMSELTYQCCQLLANLPIQSGGKILPVRKKSGPNFDFF